MKTNAFNYYLWINGLFGRNRKVKFDTFDIFKSSPTELSLQEIEARLASMLPTIKIKKAVCKIKCQPCQVDEFSTSFQLFTDITLKEFKIGMGENS